MARQVCQRYSESSFSDITRKPGSLGGNHAHVVCERGRHYQAKRVGFVRQHPLVPFWPRGVVRWSIVWESEHRKVADGDGYKYLSDECPLITR